MIASFCQSSSTTIERASFLWDEVSEANPLKKYGCLVKRFVYHYHAKLLKAFFFESWLLGKVASKKVWSGDSWGEAPNNIRFSTRKRGTKNLAWKAAYRVLTVAIWASCLRSLTWGSCESLIGLSSGPKQFLNLSPLIIAHSTARTAINLWSSCLSESQHKNLPYFSFNRYPMSILLYCLCLGGSWIKQQPSEHAKKL